MIVYVLYELDEGILEVCENTKDAQAIRDELLEEDPSRPLIIQMHASRTYKEWEEAQ